MVTTRIPVARLRGEGRFGRFTGLPYFLQYSPNTIFVSILFMRQTLNGNVSKSAM